MSEQLWMILAMGVLAVLFLLFFLMQIFSSRKLAKNMEQALIQNQLETAQSLSALQNRMNSELLQFHDSVTASLKGDFHNINLSTMAQLTQIANRTNQAFEDFKVQLTRIDETQKNLTGLSQNITALQNILMDKKSRGTFGEVELYSLLEIAFGTNDSRYRRQYTLSNNTKVDAVIFGPPPMGIIPIDSKFPLENYNRMVDGELSDTLRSGARAQFVRDVRKHIDDIATKYIIAGETTDFAYLFIPAEAVFAEIIGRMDDLVQYSYRQHVYLVSPTTLMAYLTAIKAIYLGQQRNEKVELIQKAFNNLSDEFTRFAKRFTEINRDFERLHTDFYQVSTTSEKIQRRFADIKAVDLGEQEELELPQDSGPALLPDLDEL
ncbi:MAG: DNA recombination protein RmuC [Erysipelotrichaceae bacterium]|jgi:DNA recombination protein RmuC|nr:DNA recombination protein RmuC [Erysipelotrichaceae bacterium]